MTAKKNNDGCGCFWFAGLLFLAGSLCVTLILLFSQLRNADPNVESCGSLWDKITGSAYNSPACNHAMNVRMIQVLLAEPVGLIIILVVVGGFIAMMLGNGPDASGTIRSGGSSWSWKAWFK